MFSITANDPNGTTVDEISGFSSGDTVTLTYTNPTNRIYPTEVGKLTKTDINNMYSFKDEATGNLITLNADYTGVWTSTTTMVITFTNVSNNPSPEIGSFILIPKVHSSLSSSAKYNVKDRTGVSLTTTDPSNVLAGNWGSKAGPIISSFIADGSSGIYDNNVKLTINFAYPTNKQDPTPSNPLTQSDIDSLFEFSQNIGDVSGVWTTSTSLQLTVNNANSASPTIGDLTVTIKPTSQIRDKTNTSTTSVSSQVLSGTFGQFTVSSNVCESGLASATLPNGIIAGVSSVDICTTFNFVKQTDSSTNNANLISILGTVLDISPIDSDGDGTPDNACGTDGCEISFTFTADDASSLGLNPFDVVIYHDENDDGILDDTEDIPSTVTQIEDELYFIVGTVDHFSKFAMGGVKALALGGLISSSSNSVSVLGHGSESDTISSNIYSPSMLSFGNSQNGFGAMLNPIDLNSVNGTLTFKPHEKLSFTYNLFEDKGITNIDHVGLYLNNIGKDLRIQNYDTSIEYDAFSLVPLKVHDPNGLLESYDFKITEIDAYNFVIRYTLQFSKDVDTTNLYVVVWDLDKNPSYATYEGILKISSEESLPTQIPTWIKNSAEWWASGLITDDDFIKGLEFLVQSGIVHVSSSSIDETNSTIPPWVKNSAKWWSEGMISDDDFINTVQYLINTGIIQV